MLLELEICGAYVLGVGSGKRVDKGRKCVVLVYWGISVGVVSDRSIARGGPVERPSRGTELKGG
jgi:hypothetical protein